jgi:hypothetical protein
MIVIDQLDGGHDSVGCSTTTPEQRDRIQFSVSAQARDTTPFA